MATGTSLTAEAVPKNSQAMAEALDEINARSAAFPTEKGPRRRTGTLAGYPSRRLESDLKIPEGVTIVVESTIVGDQVYTLVAGVPTALKDSAEVARFFASFRLQPNEPEKAVPKAP